MKPNKYKRLPLVDWSLFRFVFIGAMIGFVWALWFCARFEIFETAKVWLVIASCISLLALAGLGLHFLTSRFDSAQPATKKTARTAFFVTVGFACIGIGVSSLGIQATMTTDFMQLFCWCMFLVVVGVLIVLFVWILSSAGNSIQTGIEQGKIHRQLNYEKHMRRKARYKRSVDLNKQDFQTRLTSFVSHTQAVAELEESEPEEPFVSTMPFWQRSPFQIGKLPKPVDLIRVLLHRISKAVYQGKS